MPLPNQTLGTKEKNLFHSIPRYHEKKQYKKAMRCCDDILKVHKEHGETLALKGLTYNFLDKKEEAYKYCRLGIRYNIMSPICWHTYGLVYRSDGDYKEAKKCYMNAMKRDKTNLHILRDLSLLQIQLRDLAGYLRTRKAVLHLKEGNAASWFTFCMAWELLGRYNEAIDVMIAYEEITEGSEKLKGTVLSADCETGERKLYIAHLYQQAGRYQDALNFLNENESRITDKHGVKVMRAELLLQAEDYEAAKKVYRQLINTNPENLDFHLGLQRAYRIGSGNLDELTNEQVAELSELYNELRERHGRCDALKTVPLRFLKPGETFERKLHNYLQPALRKGVPSLFATLEFFYKNSPEKAKIIGDAVIQYYSTLKSNGRFPGNEEEDSEEPPSSLFWTILFLAQHYDRLGQTDEALKKIDEAIEHTPTVVDIYAFRAIIYKNAGALQKAADSMDECRELDLADRYLNTQATIYLLNADRVEQADKTVELFTRDAEGVCTSLAETQCVWFEQAAADSHLRTKDYGKSLKKALSITSHFDEFIEDQFDFHSYCLRKMTLRAYRDLLSFEDRIKSHDNYYNAAVVAVKNYIALHDAPLQAAREEEDMMEGLDDKERQKMKNKLKKAQRKKKLEEDKKREERAKLVAQKKRAGVVIEADPDGDELMRVENPLNEAAKYANSLEEWCSDRLETHLLSFEVYFRKEKYLRALRSVKTALAMEPENHQVHYNLVRLASIQPEAVDEIVRGVFVEQLKEVTGGKSAEELNEAYSSRHANDELASFAVLRAKAFLHPEDKATLGSGVKVTDNLNRSDCETIYALVQSSFGKGVSESYRQAAHEKFPFVSAFAPSESQ